MSKNDIKKMNYPMVNAMADALGKGSQQLEESIGEINKVNSLLEDGGLRGDAGASFTEAIGSSLLPAMQRLQEKLEELQSDVIAARNEMQIADRAAAQAHAS